MIVVDANVAVKTYMVEAGSDAATKLLSGPSRLLAPELIRQEVCGALCRRVRQGELEPEDAEARCKHWLALLEKGIITLTPDQELLPQAIGLSTKLKHPLADCLYLAIAQQFKIPLITADHPFHDRAKPLYKKISIVRLAPYAIGSRQFSVGH